jgi:hypothetical protein
MFGKAHRHRPPGKRLGNRLRLGVPAGLVLPYRTHRCRIVDVSANGARIRVERPIQTDRTAMLHFHELRAYGTVVWCRAGECGLAFDPPLAQEDIEGFLWIVQNPDAYARFCGTSGGRDWSIGLGG